MSILWWDIILECLISWPLKRETNKDLQLEPDKKANNLHEGDHLYYFDGNFDNVAKLYLHTCASPSSLNPRYNPCLNSLVWDTNKGLKSR